MNSKATSKPAVRGPHQTRKDVRAAFERLAAEFGPKPGGKQGRRKRVGAVELLIKLRRGEA